MGQERKSEMLKPSLKTLEWILKLANLSLTGQNSLSNLGLIRFKPCFLQVQAEILKMDILEVTAKPPDCPEVARLVSPSCNHLPLCSQYCLRISRDAGIQNNQDQGVRDADKYREGLI